jgi:hypothetical protein
MMEHTPNNPSRRVNLALAQFLMPGEEIRYESSGAVRHGRTSFALYVTDERLLLHAVAGRFVPKEKVVAERLADIDSMEYSEEGVFGKRGKLTLRLRYDTLSLTGSPATIKEVWRTLQQSDGRPAAADDEVTLVAPLPPLFEDEPSHVSQVQPLPVRPVAARRPPASPLALTIVGVCLAVLIAAVLFAFWRGSLLPGRPAGTQPPPEAAATSPPATPSPTPFRLHVMDETFTLEPGAHRAVKFTIPGEYPSARVAGGFRVTTGSYVDFYMMSEDQYDRYAGGGPPDVTSVVYRERQWNARVGERLSAGTYYLVFDNWQGEAAAQTVAAEFFVVFD